jgi:hypothetical protein
MCIERQLKEKLEKGFAAGSGLFRPVFSGEQQTCPGI